MLQIKRIKDSVILFNLNPRHWTETLELKINSFIREPKIKLLTVYYEEKDLFVGYDFPKEQVVDVQYFIKVIDGINLSVGNFSQVVITSTIHGSVEGSLFLTMTKIYAPMLNALSTNHKCILFLKFEIFFLNSITHTSLQKANQPLFFVKLQVLVGFQFL